MPVLGLMVEESEVSRTESEIAPNQLELAMGVSKSEDSGYRKTCPVSYLVAYVQFAIAKDISCEILKNDQFFKKIERNSADFRKGM